MIPLIAYRIYTENKNLDNIKDYLKKCFLDDYTLYQTTGCYKGTEENSIVIEILSENNQMVRDKILCFINVLKCLNEQKTVLLGYQFINGEFL